MVRNELQEWAPGGYVECRSGGFGHGRRECAGGFGVIGADVVGGASVHRKKPASRGR